MGTNNTNAPRHTSIFRHSTVTTLLGFQLPWGLLAKAILFPLGTDNLCVGQQISVAVCESRAQECIDALQQWYEPQKGTWATTSWWNAGNAVTGIIHYSKITGDKKYIDVINNTFERCKEFTVEKGTDREWTCRNFINAWYDDEGWWILAWIDAYDLTRDPKYLAMAERTFADMTNGWDDVCGGGVYWKKPNIGKHSVTNGLFMLSALRLSQRSKATVNGQTYLGWADMAWKWIQAKGLIIDDHLVENGLDDKCQLSKGSFYTYNQGILMAALVEYSTVTDNESHLELAHQIASASIRRLSKDGILQEASEPTLSGDSAQFKGVFMRHLRTLYEQTRKPEYRDFILKNAESIWQNARDKNGKIGGLWTGPFDQADAARQSSALDALNAAIVAARAESR